MEVTDEELQIVREEPLMLLVNLPGGYAPGRSEAADAFGEIIASLRKKYPGKSFQYLPFSYATPRDGTDPALNAILAVAN